MARLLVTDYAEGTPERIQHVRFSDIVARVGVDPQEFLGGGLDIEDLSGEEDSLITDIDFNGVSINEEYNNSFAAYIRNVKDVRRLDVKFIKPKRRVAINGSSFVSLIDCVVDDPGTWARPASASATRPAARTSASMAATIRPEFTGSFLAAARRRR